MIEAVFVVSTGGTSDCNGVDSPEPKSPDELRNKVGSDGSRV